MLSQTTKYYGKSAKKIDFALPPTQAGLVGRAKFNHTLPKNSRQLKYNISYRKYERDRLDTTSQFAKTLPYSND